jgi:hypothetical protein
VQAKVSPPAYVSIQHTSVDSRHKYRRLHTSAYSIRQRTVGTSIAACIYVSIQHTAYVRGVQAQLSAPAAYSIRHCASAYVRIHQHTSANVSIRWAGTSRAYISISISRIYIYFYIACNSQASSAGKKATSTSENVLPRKNGPYKRTSASVYVLLYQ